MMRRVVEGGEMGLEEVEEVVVEVVVEVEN